jgi:hypothetical protein
MSGAPTPSLRIRAVRLRERLDALSLETKDRAQATARAEFASHSLHGSTGAVRQFWDDARVLADLVVQCHVLRSALLEAIRAAPAKDRSLRDFLLGCLDDLQPVVSLAEATMRRHDAVKRKVTLMLASSRDRGSVVRSGRQRPRDVHSRWLQPPPRPEGEGVPLLNPSLRMSSSGATDVPPPLDMLLPAPILGDIPRAKSGSAVEPFAKAAPIGTSLLGRAEFSRTRAHSNVPGSEVPFSLNTFAEHSEVLSSPFLDAPTTGLSARDLPPSTSTQPSIAAALGPVESAPADTFGSGEAEAAESGSEGGYSAESPSAEPHSPRHREAHKGHMIQLVSTWLSRHDATPSSSAMDGRQPLHPRIRELTHNEESFSSLPSSILSSSQSAEEDDEADAPIVPPAPQWVIGRTHSSPPVTEEEEEEEDAPPHSSPPVPSEPAPTTVRRAKSSAQGPLFWGLRDEVSLRRNIGDPSSSPPHPSHWLADVVGSRISLQEQYRRSQLEALLSAPASQREIDQGSSLLTSVSQPESPGALPEATALPRSATSVVATAALPESQAPEVSRKLSAVGSDAAPPSPAVDTPPPTPPPANLAHQCPSSMEPKDRTIASVALGWLRMLSGSSSNDPSPLVEGILTEPPSSIESDAQLALSLSLEQEAAAAGGLHGSSVSEAHDDDWLPEQRDTREKMTTMLARDTVHVFLDAVRTGSALERLNGAASLHRKCTDAETNVLIWESGGLSALLDAVCDASHGGDSDRGLMRASKEEAARTLVSLIRFCPSLSDTPLRPTHADKLLHAVGVAFNAANADGSWRHRRLRERAMAVDRALKGGAQTDVAWVVAEAAGVDAPSIQGIAAALVRLLFESQLSTSESGGRPAGRGRGLTHLFFALPEDDDEDKPGDPAEGADDGEDDLLMASDDALGNVAVGRTPDEIARSNFEQQAIPLLLQLVDPSQTFPSCPCSLEGRPVQEGLTPTATNDGLREARCRVAQVWQQQRWQWDDSKRLAMIAIEYLARNRRKTMRLLLREAAVERFVACIQSSDPELSAAGVRCLASLCRRPSGALATVLGSRADVVMAIREALDSAKHKSSRHRVASSMLAAASTHSLLEPTDSGSPILTRRGSSLPDMFDDPLPELAAATAETHHLAAAERTALFVPVLEVLKTFGDLWALACEWAVSAGALDALIETLAPPVTPPDAVLRQWNREEGESVGGQSSPVARDLHEGMTFRGEGAEGPASSLEEITKSGVDGSLGGGDWGFVRLLRRDGRALVTEGQVIEKGYRLLAGLCGLPSTKLFAAQAGVMELACEILRRRSWGHADTLAGGIRREMAIQPTRLVERGGSPVAGGGGDSVVRTLSGRPKGSPNGGDDDSARSVASSGGDEADEDDTPEGGGRSSPSSTSTSSERVTQESESIDTRGQVFSLGSLTTGAGQAEAEVWVWDAGVRAACDTIARLCSTRAERSILVVALDMQSESTGPSHDQLVEIDNLTGLTAVLSGAIPLLVRMLDAPFDSRLPVFSLRALASISEQAAFAGLVAEQSGAAAVARVVHRVPAADTDLRKASARLHKVEPGQVAVYEAMIERETRSLSQLQLHAALALSRLANGDIGARRALLRKSCIAALLRLASGCKPAIVELAVRALVGLAQVPCPQCVGNSRVIDMLEWRQRESRILLDLPESSPVVAPVTVPAVKVSRGSRSIPSWTIDWSQSRLTGKNSSWAAAWGRPTLLAESQEDLWDSTDVVEGDTPDLASWVKAQEQEAGDSDTSLPLREQLAKEAEAFAKLSAATSEDADLVRTPPPWLVSITLCVRCSMGMGELAADIAAATYSVHAWLRSKHQDRGRFPDPKELLPGATELPAKAVLGTLSSSEGPTEAATRLQDLVIAVDRSFAPATVAAQAERLLLIENPSLSMRRVSRIHTPAGYPDERFERVPRSFHWRFSTPEKRSPSLPSDSDVCIRFPAEQASRYGVGPMLIPLFWWPSEEVQESVARILASLCVRRRHRNLLARFIVSPAVEIALEARKDALRAVAKESARPFVGDGSESLSRLAFQTGRVLRRLGLGAGLLDVWRLAGPISSTDASASPRPLSPVSPVSPKDPLPEPLATSVSARAESVALTTERWIRGLEALARQHRRELRMRRAVQRAWEPTSVSRSRRQLRIARARGLWRPPHRAAIATALALARAGSTLSAYQPSLRDASLYGIGLHGAFRPMLPSVDLARVTSRDLARMVLQTARNHSTALQVLSQLVIINADRRSKPFALVEDRALRVPAPAAAQRHLHPKDDDEDADDDGGLIHHTLSAPAASLSALAAEVMAHTRLLEAGAPRSGMGHLEHTIPARMGPSALEATLHLGITEGFFRMALTRPASQVPPVGPVPRTDDADGTVLLSRLPSQSTVLAVLETLTAERQASGEENPLARLVPAAQTRQVSPRHLGAVTELASRPVLASARASLLGSVDRSIRLARAGPVFPPKKPPTETSLKRVSAVGRGGLLRSGISRSSRLGGPPKRPGRGVSLLVPNPAVPPLLVPQRGIIVGGTAAMRRLKRFGSAFGPDDRQLGDLETSSEEDWFDALEAFVEEQSGAPPRSESPLEEQEDALTPVALTPVTVPVPLPVVYRKMRSRVARGPAASATESHVDALVSSSDDEEMGWDALGGAAASAVTVARRSAHPHRRRQGSPGGEGSMSEGGPDSDSSSDSWMSKSDSSDEDTEEEASDTGEQGADPRELPADAFASDEEEIMHGSWMEDTEHYLAGTLPPTMLQRSAVGPWFSATHCAATKATKSSSLSKAPIASCLPRCAIHEKTCAPLVLLSLQRPSVGQWWWIRMRACQSLADGQDIPPLLMQQAQSMLMSLTQSMEPSSSVQVQHRTVAPPTSTVKGALRRPRTALSRTFAAMSSGFAWSAAGDMEEAAMLAARESQLLQVEGADAQSRAPRTKWTVAIPLDAIDGSTWTFLSHELWMASSSLECVVFTPPAPPEFGASPTLRRVQSSFGAVVVPPDRAKGSPPLDVASAVTLLRLSPHSLPWVSFVGIGITEGALSALCSWSVDSWVKACHLRALAAGKLAERRATLVSLSAAAAAVSALPVGGPQEAGTEAVDCRLWMGPLPTGNGVLGLSLRDAGLRPGVLDPIVHTLRGQGGWKEARRVSKLAQALTQEAVASHAETELVLLRDAERAWKLSRSAVHAPAATCSDVVASVLSSGVSFPGESGSSGSVFDVVDIDEFIGTKDTDEAQATEAIRRAELFTQVPRDGRELSSAVQPTVLAQAIEATRLDQPAVGFSSIGGLEALSLESAVELGVEQPQKLLHTVVGASLLCEAVRGAASGEVGIGNVAFSSEEESWKLTFGVPQSVQLKGTVGLRWLDLANNALGDAGAAQILHAAMHSPVLIGLDLAGNGIGTFATETLKVLSRSRGLLERSVSLRYLSLANNGLGDDAVALLIGALVTLAPPDGPENDSVSWSIAAELLCDSDTSAILASGVGGRPSSKPSRLRREPFSRLSVLDLSMNLVGSLGAAPVSSLAGSSWAKSPRLQYAAPSLSNAEAAILSLFAQGGGSLRELILTGNPLGGEFAFRAYSTLKGAMASRTTGLHLWFLRMARTPGPSKRDRRKILSLLRASRERWVRRRAVSYGLDLRAFPEWEANVFARSARIEAASVPVAPTPSGPSTETPEEARAPTPSREDQLERYRSQASSRTESTPDVAALSETNNDSLTGLTSPKSPVESSLSDELPDEASLPIVVVVGASPLAFFNSAVAQLQSLAPIAVEAERASVWRGFQEAMRPVQFVFGFLTQERFMAVLSNPTPISVLHIAAHGADPSSSLSWIALETEGGHAAILQSFRSLLATVVSTRPDARLPVDLVFLNVCNSEGLGEFLVSAGAQHVVCVRNGCKVADDAGPPFVNEFYRQIAAGSTVEAAFSLAKERLASAPNLPTAVRASQSDMFVLLPRTEPAYDIPEVFEATHASLSERHGLIAPGDVFRFTHLCGSEHHRRVLFSPDRPPYRGSWPPQAALPQLQALALDTRPTLAHAEISIRESPSTGSDVDQLRRVPSERSHADGDEARVGVVVSGWPGGSTAPKVFPHPLLRVPAGVFEDFGEFFTSCRGRLPSAAVDGHAFCGRRVEACQLLQRLLPAAGSLTEASKFAAGSTRVTLVGPPGVGKSALARFVCNYLAVRRHVRLFPHGIMYVNFEGCSATTNPASFLLAVSLFGEARVEAILSAFRSQRKTGLGPAAAIREVLRTMGGGSLAGEVQPRRVTEPPIRKLSGGGNSSVRRLRSNTSPALASSAGDISPPSKDLSEAPRSRGPLVDGQHVSEEELDALQVAVVDSVHPLSCLLMLDNADGVKVSWLKGFAERLRDEGARLVTLLITRRSGYEVDASDEGDAWRDDEFPIGSMHVQDSVQLIRNRLGDAVPMSVDTIKSIFQRSLGHPGNMVRDVVAYRRSITMDVDRTGGEPRRLEPLPLPHRVVAAVEATGFGRRFGPGEPAEAAPALHAAAATASTLYGAFPALRAGRFPLEQRIPGLADSGILRSISMSDVPHRRDFQ